MIVDLQMKCGGIGRRSDCERSSIGFVVSRRLWYPGTRVPRVVGTVLVSEFLYLSKFNSQNRKIVMYEHTVITDPEERRNPLQPSLGTYVLPDSHPPEDERMAFDRDLDSGAVFVGDHLVATGPQMETYCRHKGLWTCVHSWQPGTRVPEYPGRVHRYGRGWGSGF